MQLFGLDFFTLFFNVFKRKLNINNLRLFCAGSSIIFTPEKPTQKDKLSSINDAIYTAYSFCWDNAKIIVPCILGVVLISIIQYNEVNFDHIIFAGKLIKNAFTIIFDGIKPNSLDGFHNSADTIHHTLAYSDKPFYLTCVLAGVSGLGLIITKTLYKGSTQPVLDVIPSNLDVIIPPKTIGKFEALYHAILDLYVTNIWLSVLFTILLYHLFCKLILTEPKRVFINK